MKLAPLVNRYARFCSVGGTGLLVDMGIIWLLASPDVLGWNLNLSKVMAAEVAIINNFFWNDVWTFRQLTGSGNGGRLARLSKFNLICLTGIGLSVVLLNVQVHWLRLNFYFANLISIVVVSLWNFFLNLRFGWTRS